MTKQGSTTRITNKAVQSYSTQGPCPGLIVAEVAEIAEVAEEISMAVTNRKLEREREREACRCLALWALEFWRCGPRAHPHTLLHLYPSFSFPSLFLPQLPSFPFPIRSNVKPKRKKNSILLIYLLRNTAARHVSLSFLSN